MRSAAYLSLLTLCFSWTGTAFAQVCNPLDPFSPCNRIENGIDALEGNSGPDSVDGVDTADQVIIVPTDVITPAFQPLEEGENQFRYVKPFASTGAPGEDDDQEDQDHTDWKLLSGSRAAALLDLGRGHGRVLNAATGEKLGVGLWLVAGDNDSHQNAFATTYGDLLLPQKSEALVEICDECMRVFNLSTMSAPIYVYLPPAAGKPRQAIGIASGVELVATRKRLTRRLLLLDDGVARRDLTRISNNYGVCEYSLETLLSRSDRLTGLLKSLPARERRRLLDKWSKMAAVLGYTRGRNGFMLVAK